MNSRQRFIVDIKKYRFFKNIKSKILKKKTRLDWVFLTRYLPSLTGPDLKFRYNYAGDEEVSRDGAQQLDHL